MAFSCRPELIVLDEPTTGLDVATQRHVLDTVRGLCSSYGVSAVYVTHDLAVIAEIADHVAVMYAGQLIELGTTRAVFDSPAHPYTDGLLKAIPSPEICHALVGMEGQPPSPGRRPPGCLFEPRCPHAIPACSAGRPAMIAVNGDAHQARCIRAQEIVHTSTGVEELAAESATLEDGPTGPALLEVGHLDARYADTQILHDVSLIVPRTSCVAVVGESGSGKTTLARCIIGLARALDGKRAVRGRAAPGSGQRPRPRGPALGAVHLPEPVHVAQSAQDDRAARRAAADSLLQEASRAGAHGSRGGHPRGCAR